MALLAHYFVILHRSCMSELTDFGDLMAAVGAKDGEGNTRV